jgi:hypothetical protein
MPNGGGYTPGPSNFYPERAGGRMVPSLARTEDLW